MINLSPEIVVEVVNHKSTREGIYIGRTFAGNPESPLHNPFPLRRDASDVERDRCIAKFRSALMASIDRVANGGLDEQDLARCRELDRLVTLAREGRLQLRCWCAPKACHGDVIAEIIKEAIATGQRFSVASAPSPKTYGTCWKCSRGYIVPGLDHALCPHDGWVANPWKKINTNQGTKCNSSN